MKIKILAIAALFISINAFADPGNEAMPFLRVGRNPISIGMAGSGLASTSSPAWASFSNPAAVVFAEQTFDAGVSLISWQPKYNSSFGPSLSGSYKWNNFGFTLGFSYVNGEELELSDFTPNEVQVNGGVGYKISDGFSIGGNLRYASHALTSENSMSAICGDVFAMVRFGDFNIAAGVSCIGNKVKVEGGSKDYSLPMSASFALNWHKLFAEKHGLEVNIDADYYFSETTSVAAGLQYGYNDMIFARAGYRFGGESIIPSYASIGLGAKFKGFRLDAAYLLGSDTLKNSFVLGIGYSF